MTNTITKPADLPKDRYITRDEYRAWQDENYEYHAAIAHQEEQERKRQEAAEAKANAFLTSAEYDQIKRQEQEERQAREAARAADLKAEQDAKEAYLASHPDVAEVSERSEYAFLLRLQHWFGLGYTASEDSVQAFIPGFYNVQLNSPAKSERKQG